MPIITEEQANALDEVDFSQILNNEPVSPEAKDGSAFVEEGRPFLAFCPIHTDSTDCTCPGFVDDWDLPETQLDLLSGLEEPDYSKFENWIPRYIRPEKPCDYCRSRRLNCYLQRGEPHCTPCASLFRECSLTKSNTLEATNYIENPTGTFLDTLHVVDEDAAKERGTFTGIKPLRSKVATNGSSTPIRGDDAPGSTKRNGIRFPRHAVKTLRDWLDSHIDHPYPTEDEKVELEKLTELKPNQIANWLANARRRKKVAQKIQPKSLMSPSLRPSTPAIAIPRASSKPWEELNPLERWKNSPPEHDPASITDIAKAVANSDLPDDEVSSSPSSMGRRGKGSSNGSALSNLRAPSTTSQETVQTSSISAPSTAFSHNSSVSTHGSFGSFNSSLAGKRNRRQRRRPAPVSNVRTATEDKRRIFQCTFCTDTFKSKYDWTRHEKSLHLSLEKWICAPQGPIVTDQGSGSSTCAYCNIPNPSKDHLESHNHQQCEDKGLDSRTFFRKDHLRQHLRLMHGCEMTKPMDDWRMTASMINSRCGFCSQRFSMWQDRVDHLTAHFKAGARMSEWKGCRGLDPAVAAQVTNAMPPYLIGIESVSPNPFSATSRSWRETREDNVAESEQNGQHDMQNEAASCSAGSGSKATCFEILTLHLGKYAKQMAARGQVMTDDMLQAQARRIIYDSDDAWNQTAADNAEWLDLFKKAHGLNFIPNALGGQGLCVPEDLETYSDLGLRIPFAVQLQALNSNTVASGSSRTVNTGNPYQELIEQRRKELQDIYAELVKGGVLYSDKQRCNHIECAANVIDLSSVDGASAKGYSPKRWCSRELPPERASQMTAIAERGKTSAKIISNHTIAQRKEVTDRKFQALWDLHESINGGDKCDWIGHKSSSATTQAVDSGTKQQDQQQADYQSANARARSLVALARAEAPMPMKEARSVGQSCTKKSLPRYRYELPEDRAQQFETITGAWADSGTMPKPFSTSVNQPTTVQPQATISGGSTIEFLGGNASTSLPFSNDTSASRIVSPETAFTTDELAWQLPEDAFHNDEMLMEQLDELIRTTTAVPTEALTSTDTATDTSTQAQDLDALAMDLTWTENIPDITLDSSMEDFDFDDMTFDGVFDMQLDDTFETGNAA